MAYCALRKPHLLLPSQRLEPELEQQRLLRQQPAAQVCCAAGGQPQYVVRQHVLAVRLLPRAALHVLLEQRLHVRLQNHMQQSLYNDDGLQQSSCVTYTSSCALLLDSRPDLNLHAKQTGKPHSAHAVHEGTPVAVVMSSGAATAATASPHCCAPLTWMVSSDLLRSLASSIAFNTAMIQIMQHHAHNNIHQLLLCWTFHSMLEAGPSRCLLCCKAEPATVAPRKRSSAYSSNSSSEISPVGTSLYIDNSKYGPLLAWLVGVPPTTGRGAELIKFICCCYQD